MLRSGGSGAWGARHYVAPQVRVTERDASNVSLSAQHPFFVVKGVLLFVLQDVCPESLGSNFAGRSGSTIGKPLPSAERFLVARWSRHRSRAATSNGASVRKPGRRTPSARASRVTRTAPSRATFARHCRRSCRRRRPATPRPTSTVAARARSTSSPAEASWRARPLPLRAWGALPT